MRYFMYQDAQGLWRWRLYAANNRLIADSGESYYNANDCLAGINLVKSSGNAPVYQTIGKDTYKVA